MRWVCATVGWRAGTPHHDPEIATYLSELTVRSGLETPDVGDNQGVSLEPAGRMATPKAAGENGGAAVPAPPPLPGGNQLVLFGGRLMLGKCFLHVCMLVSNWAAAGCTGEGLLMIHRSQIRATTKTLRRAGLEVVLDDAGALAGAGRCVGSVQQRGWPDPSSIQGLRDCRQMVGGVAWTPNHNSKSWASWRA